MLIIIHFCSLVVKLSQCREKKRDGNCETSTQYPVPTGVLGPKSNPPEVAAEHLVCLMCQLLFTLFRGLQLSISMVHLGKDSSITIVHL
jgi:hypothetical protein